MIHPGSNGSATRRRTRPRRPRLAQATIVPALALALAAALPGCGDEGEVRVYDAPRTPRLADAGADAAERSAAPTTVTTSLPAVDAEAARVEADEAEASEAPASLAFEEGLALRRFEAGPIRGAIPAHWSPVQAEPPRVLAFDVEGESYRAEVALTRFPGDVGGELANVNRWRRQVGLPPVDSPEQQDAVAFTHDGVPASLTFVVDPQRGPDGEAILVATLPRGDHTWFVKMTGPARMIGSEHGPMLAFLDRLRLPPASD